MNLVIDRIIKLLDMKPCTYENNGIIKYYNKDYDVLLSKNQVLITDKRKTKHIIYPSLEILESIINKEKLR